jgi:FkbM family methyltransferase
MSQYSQIETTTLSVLRKRLRRLLPLFSWFTRRCWQLSPLPGTTFFENSIIWKVLWAVTRFVGAIPATEPHTVLCNLGNGIRMALELDRLTDCLVLSFGPGEHDVIATVTEFCESSAVVLDVGANIGSVAIPAAKYLTRGRVIAFEPNPPILNSFKRNVSLSRICNLDIIPMALSNWTGPSHLVLGQEGNPGSCFLDEAQKNWPTVNVQPLDEAVADLERVDLIKIDVEGSETAVIDGAAQVISRFRPVMILEINRTQLKRSGSSSQELLEKLERLSYDCYVRVHKRLRVVSRADLNNGFTFNVIAIPKERTAQGIRGF